MLYLNVFKADKSTDYLPNLTLTNVVFELVVPPQASKPVAI